MAQPSVLNLSAFTTSELNALLTAAKAEVLQRMSGRVQSGGSSGENYAMSIYSADELNRLINSITDALGLDTQMNFVRPDFSNGTGSAYNSTIGVYP